MYYYSLTFPQALRVRDGSFPSLTGEVAGVEGLVTSQRLVTHTRQSWAWIQALRL